MKSNDYHLLPVLERLIATGSISETGRQLGMSAPSVSRALARLRDVYADDLLVRAGQTMIVTPRAKSLLPALRDCLDQLAQLDLVLPVRTPRDFRGDIRIRCDDVFAGAILQALFEFVGREAPGLTIRIVTELSYSSEDFRSGMVDLEVGGRGEFPPEVIVRPVGQDSLYGIVRPDHPILKQTIDAARFAAYPHVVSSTQKDFEGAMRRALAMSGLAREIRLETPTIFSAAIATRRSDLIACAPGVIAHDLGALLGLALFKVPLDLPEIRVSVAWHSRLKSEPAHQWLRNALIAIVDRKLRSARDQISNLVGA
jgi:DNA-binding transcriptional LysR family regulator